MDGVTTETREVTTTRTYVTIDGHEFRAGQVLDFLDRLAGTGSFMGYVRWRREYDDLASVLDDRGIVGTKVNGSWFEQDAEAREELYQMVRTAYVEDD